MIPMKTLIRTILFLFAAGAAQADVITGWNERADAIIVASKLGTPPAIRVMAILQTAVYDAASAARQSECDAAVAAANRETLVKLIPSQQAAIDTAYRAALALIPDGDGKTSGIAIGTKAAANVLAARANDGASVQEAYRPLTTPGVYVPTAIVAVPQWPDRKPWLLANAAQFRPGLPPALASDAWVREFNEVKALGGRTSRQRTAEQTEIARFWDYSLPPIYHGVVRSVANAPGRDAVRNARLFAAVTQAMDDAMIAVFDAKYHYNFWRPATAIRNADTDGNDATEREASWAPLIDAPMHPEYPSGHSILAAAVATILKADSAGGPLPELATSSPTAGNATRRWKTLDSFVEEVSNARIYGGIHFRAATEIGESMGRKIGALAIDRLSIAPLPRLSETAAR